MTYRFRPLPKTPLAAFVAYLVLFAPSARADNGGVSVRFTTEGTILPRRGHEVLALESVNIDRLDATILHVPEADTLRVLGHIDGVTPPEAQEIWHSQIEVKAGGKTPTVNQPVKTALDVLQTIKSLQPGIYIADVHEVTTGKPIAEARKLFVISNIGLEAFAGADGIAVQARLLSEASPALNIEIALVARNNREIARLRTDGDGVARFGKDQVSGVGEDAPAAIYAYGGDGEFTALPLTVDPIPPAPSTMASIITDRLTYKPGDEIHALVLVRDASGHAAKGSTVFMQMENADGGVAEFHSSPTGDSGGFGLTLHAPPVSGNGKWTIRAYRNQNSKPVLLGQASITVAPSEVTPQGPPAKPDIAAPSDIVISPGRRSFQRGETANISVQPQSDSYVTVALVDSSVHAIVRERIGKEGAVLQLPIPPDAVGGMYVIATAFAVPPNNGKDAYTPIHRSFGLQWIDIDEGANRMSVRLDTPERVEANGKLPIIVTLPDLNGRPGQVQIVATDATLPVTLDPLAFFYGRKPLQVRLFDTYASIIGAPEPAAPDLSSQAPLLPPSAPALLWPATGTVGKGGKVEFTETFPNMTGPDPRLRISALAWSDDKLGFGEATVLEAPMAKATKKPIKKPAGIPTSTHTRATTIKPGDSITLKSHDAVIVSVDPILATPVSYNTAGATGEEQDADESVFLTSDMPQFRAYMLGLLTSQDDQTLLHDAILSFGLPSQKLELPGQTISRMLDAVQAILAKPDIDPNQAMLAHYVLLKSGRETALEVAAWLAGNPKLDDAVAKAARIALASKSPLFQTDTARLQSALEDQATNGDLELRAMTLLVLAQANQPWPPKLAHAVSEEAVKALLSLPARTDLALRLAEAAHYGFGAPKLKIEGTPDGNGQIMASGSAVKVVNADTSPLYAWIVTGLSK